jgi:hypothetical protein
MFAVRTFYSSIRLSGHFYLQGDVMVVRARSVIALAIAAAPLAGAHAATIGTPAGTPSFNCNTEAAGGTIDWGDGTTSLVPLLGLGSDAGSLKFMPLACSNSLFSESLPTDPRADPYFQLKMGDGSLADGSVKIDSFDYKIQDKSSDGFKVTLWDIMMKFDASGVVFTDFLGIKITSDTGFVNDGGLKISDSGALLLDPSNPGGDTVVSLYGTPQVTPEPSGLVLLGTGLLGIGAAVRRRLGW